MRLSLFLCCLSFVFVANNAFAHGPIHEKIEEVNKRIAVDPENASLYIERSSYYKLDGQFDQAHADLLIARRLNPSIKTIDFLAAELCFEFEYYNTALSYINLFEQQQMSLGETLLLKSKIFDKLFISDSALIYITKAYEHQDRYTTYFFTLASTFSVYANKDDYDAAYQWLKLGKSHLPYDLVLQKEMVSLSINYKKYDEAERLCLEQLPKLKRQESWYYQLAEVYSLKGDTAKALIALDNAEASVNKLPRHHKNTDFIKNLSKDINMLRAQLNQS